ncbi:phosphonate metabolism protein/1,5-bisphosphokinase (PRPP-forming) PhnN [Geminicoccaceae bacterium 1502E]|nr:phosphonate metabolism protein/1,5-bisphosphokinase (PRPP-forming) PhnN [Geminicoccaceae bacterium 1502E]
MVADQMRGVLFLVVGPSGAGKDSVIDGARRQLAETRSIEFPRRFVTRPAEAGGEDHLPLCDETFARMEAAGAFALSWRAHGLAYGVPASIAQDLATGRSVVVNVSRAVIDEARRLFQPLRVLVVTAPPAVLAARLASRGREDAADIEARLARGGRYELAGSDVVTLINDGPLETAIERCVALLREPLAA